MRQHSRLYLFITVTILLLNPSLVESTEPNPFGKFLNDIKYSSRLKIEHEDNIFLQEDGEEPDLRQIFTQTFQYQSTRDNHFFQWGYTGDYAYYTEESLGVLEHSAQGVYSYRPEEKFSFGIKDKFDWAQDEKIPRTFGDRVLALGYVRNAPTLQGKYELSPRGVLSTEIAQQFLDVRNADTDDEIDNKSFNARTQITYDLAENGDVQSLIGWDHVRTTFPQIAEKASTVGRVFIGLLNNIKGVLMTSHEVGFQSTDFDEDTSIDDNNIDYQFGLETIFSVKTKLRLGYEYNMKHPSFRREYAQYAGHKTSLDINHAVNKTTSINLDYAYDRLVFDSSDRLVGQPDEDADIGIHTWAVTLSQKLKSWLTCDWSYENVHRDSDFAGESYVDNTWSLALTAKY